MIANRATDDLSDNFRAGNFPDLDRLSLTVCPVHALSTPGEWVEMAWAARDAALKAKNLAKIRDKDSKLEDFQLRIVAAELVLFNLKTGQTYLLYDEDGELLEVRPEPASKVAAASPRAMPRRPGAGWIRRWGAITG